MGEKAAWPPPMEGVFLEFKTRRNTRCPVYVGKLRAEPGMLHLDGVETGAKHKVPLKSWVLDGKGLPQKMDATSIVYRYTSSTGPHSQFTIGVKADDGSVRSRLEHLYGMVEWAVSNGRNWPAGIPKLPGEIDDIPKFEGPETAQPLHQPPPNAKPAQTTLSAFDEQQKLGARPPSVQAFRLRTVAVDEGVEPMPNRKRPESATGSRMKEEEKKRQGVLSTICSAPRPATSATQVPKRQTLVEMSMDNGNMNRGDAENRRPDSADNGHSADDLHSTRDENRPPTRAIKPARLPSKKFPSDQDFLPSPSVKTKESQRQPDRAKIDGYVAMQNMSGPPSTPKESITRTTPQRQPSVVTIDDEPLVEPTSHGRSEGDFYGDAKSTELFGMNQVEKRDAGVKPTQSERSYNNGERGKEKNLPLFSTTTIPYPHVKGEDRKFIYRSLRNITNSCYVNSTLQALSAALGLVARMRSAYEELCEKNLGYPPIEEPSDVFRLLAHSLSQLTTDVAIDEEGEKKYERIEPVLSAGFLREFRSAFIQVSDVFAEGGGTRQQDAHELINVFFDIVEEDCKGKRQKEIVKKLLAAAQKYAKDEMGEEKPNIVEVEDGEYVINDKNAEANENIRNASKALDLLNSYIERNCLLTSQNPCDSLRYRLRDIKSCSVCGAESTKPENELVMHIGLHFYMKSSLAPTLEELLSNELTGTIEAYSCGICGSKRGSAMERKFFTYLGDYLIFVPKRFGYNYVGEQTKLDFSVRIPRRLVLDRYFEPDTVHDGQVDENDILNISATTLNDGTEEEEAEAKKEAPSANVTSRRSKKPNPKPRKKWNQSSEDDSSGSDPSYSPGAGKEKKNSKKNSGNRPAGGAKRPASFAPTHGDRTPKSSRTAHRRVESDDDLPVRKQRRPLRENAAIFDDVDEGVDEKMETKTPPASAPVSTPRRLSARGIRRQEYASRAAPTIDDLNGNADVLTDEVLESDPYREGSIVEADQDWKLGLDPDAEMVDIASPEMDGRSGLPNQLLTADEVVNEGGFVGLKGDEMEEAAERDAELADIIVDSPPLPDGKDSSRNQGYFSDAYGRDFLRIEQWASVKGTEPTGHGDAIFYHADGNFLRPMAFTLGLEYRAQEDREDLLLQCSIGRVKSTLAPAEIEDIEGDGNCLFRAFSWYLTGDENAAYASIRKQLMDFMEAYFKKFSSHSGKDEEGMKAHIARMRSPGEWGSDLEISGMATLLGIDIYTYLEDPPLAEEYDRKKENRHKWLRHRPLFRWSECEANFEPDSLSVKEDTYSRCGLYLQNRSCHYDVVISLKEPPKDPMAQHVYNLVSTVLHYGSDLSHGHYTADAWDSKLRCWIRCDDSTIQKTTEKQVLVRAAKYGYVLIYKRVSPPMPIPLDEDEVKVKKEDEEF